MNTAATALEDAATLDSTQPTRRSDRPTKRQSIGSAGTKGAARTTDRTEGSKADIVVKKLRLARGVTLAQLMEATGWQAHSVRGFLSAVVRKRLGLNLLSEVGKDGQRRYRVVDGDGDGNAGAGQTA